MAYLLGGLLILVAVVAWMGSARRAGPPEPSHSLAIATPHPPPMPLGPKMPSPPIPTPK
jgi:hypothetical protein